MATCSLDGCSRRRFERDGIVHGYCGRTHAKEAVAKGTLSALKPPHGTCHVSELNYCCPVRVVNVNNVVPIYIYTMFSHLYQNTSGQHVQTIPINTCGTCM